MSAKISYRKSLSKCALLKTAGRGNFWPAQIDDSPWRKNNCQEEGFLQEYFSVIYTVYLLLSEQNLGQTILEISFSHSILDDIN